jgi:type I restriction enzyme R subunit
LPDQAANVCHHLRRLGNLATHEDKGTAAQALSCLKLARELGVWLHRTFTPHPAFSPGPFVPPLPPRDISTELAAQIEDLRAQLAASESAAASAARDAKEARRASETAVERAQREGEERALWEKLASEEESARIRVEAELRALQTANADKPPDERAELVIAAASAADRIVVDEADTRVLIDAQLVAAGWEADTLRLRYSLGTRPDRRRAIAIAEWPTETGPADYALFKDGLCLGIVEAKRSATTVPAALEQAKRYARTIVLGPDQLALDAPFAHGLDESFRVPFVFATNGRPYMRQLETQSGIWTWDARWAANRPSALPDWFSPRDLAERLEQEIAPAGFAEDPVDLPGIRPYQRAAITAIEAAIANGRREILVAMATGTGKTLTCVALMYRLLKLKRFRRILQRIREIYATQRKFLAGRPNRYEHRLLRRQMYAHTKALLATIDEIDFPLLYPEDIFPEMSMLRSAARDEEVRADLEDITRLLSMAFKSDRVLSQVRGEIPGSSGRKSLECRYIWEFVFELFDDFYEDNSPGETGPLFRVIAWLHNACDLTRPDPEAIKKAFRRWSRRRDKNH